VRDGDVAARLGGDEFAIVMRRSTPTEARAAAERLLSAVRRARPVSIEISAAVEGSAGLAAFVPGDPVSVDEALRRADLALYDAKAAGRGTVIAYPTGDGHAARQLHVRRSSVQRLAQALREDALELRARPVVDLHDGSLGGWDLAVPGDGGTTVEAEARRAGLTAHLDVWKLRRLVELAATGVAAPLGIVVDAAVLDDPALAPRLEADLRRSGAAPTRIVLGVVGTGGAPTAQAVATAQALRRLGVDLLLDDFGAGPGSLALLRGLPVSVIRTSAAVACAGSANAFDDGVVRFAADLAREFGLGIVADGVGSAADLERLRALGVRAGLGPYLGEPLSLDIAFARTPPDNQEDADECV
jgi:predicted signal transduction protein with EAL and GGDEF domain